MDTQETLVKVGDGSPKVSELITEFKRNGSQGDSFGRMAMAEESRLNRWSGQSEDGKKHAANMPEGKDPFPWEGASDVKNYLSDGVCNEMTALCYMAFWNAVLKISGGTENDLSDAATATEFLDWMLHFQLLRELDTEVELSAQFMFSQGTTALHVTWEREVGRKLVKVKMSDLMAMSQQVQQQAQAGGAAAPPYQGGQQPQMTPEQQQLQEVLSVLPQLVMDPTQEAEAIKAVQFLYEQYAEANLPADLELGDILLLSVKRARAAVRSLRLDEECELPMPYLCKNQPCISALKPFRDFVLPVEVGDVQTSPVVFVRALLTEAQLRAKVLSDGWDPTWADEAVKTKGKFSTWQLLNPYSTVGTWNWRAVDNRSWLIEVVYAYIKQVDDDGVTQCQYTVFSPHFTKDPMAAYDASELAAKNGILTNPRSDYPLILGRRERFDRSWLATRGIPEITATDQHVEKAMLDNTVDMASIMAVPPLNVPKGMTVRYKIGPAVQNEFVPGREAHFMPMPGGTLTPAMEVVAGIRAKVARYFGLFDESVAPQLSAMMMQPVVKKFLTMWGEALQMAYELSVKFAPETIEKVTGNAPSDDVDAFHYVMHFDAGQFQPELMDAKIKAFSEAAATDSTGSFDQAKLAQFKARMIDPAMAKELIIPQGQASIKIYKDVQNDILNMYAGSEAQYGDMSNDPAAENKMKAAMQILQGNPNYLNAIDPQMVAKVLGPQAGQQLAQQQQQSGAKPDARFSALLENYLKNLQQGVDQQQNKQTGRDGVKRLT
jgi:hypothetical protein